MFTYTKSRKNVRWTETILLVKWKPSTGVSGVYFLTARRIGWVFFFCLFVDDITEENPTATICLICYCETRLLSSIFRLLLKDEDQTNRITADNIFLITIQIDLSNKILTKASQFQNYGVITLRKITDRAICCHTVEKSNKYIRTKADSFSYKAINCSQSV